MSDKQDMGLVTQGDTWPQINHWFFRELSDDQRLSLFKLVGMPVDEIGKVHSNQKIALKHVLRLHRLASQADQEALIVALGNLTSLAEVADVMDEPGRVTINAARAAYALATHPQPSQKGEGDE